MTLRLPHLEARFPGWRVEVLDCEHGEEYYPVAKLAFIRSDVYAEDPEWVEAHVAVHLQRHQDVMPARRWTAEQEAQANEGAELLLALGGLR